MKKDNVLKWFKQSIVTLVILCIVLLGFELWLRFTLNAWPFEPPLYIASYLTERDATLLWRYSSGGDRNSLGLRNREILPKGPGVYRILFLGDSLVWTGDTSSGKLYTEVIEQQLNELSASHSDTIQVINAGIPGYTTYQELEFLKIYGMDMTPDYVILGFVFNDLNYKYIHRPTDSNLLGPEPAVRLNHIDPNFPGGFLFAHSYVANQVASGAQIFWRQILQREMFPFELRGDIYYSWRSYGWPREAMQIAEMQKVLKQRNMSFAIVVFPTSYQVTDRWLAIDKRYVLYPQSKIKEIADHYQIPILDLTESIYQNGGSTLYRDYLHLNPKGNDLVASQVEKFLVDQLKLLH